MVTNDNVDNVVETRCQISHADVCNEIIHIFYYKTMTVPLSKEWYVTMGPKE